MQVVRIVRTGIVWAVSLQLLVAPWAVALDAIEYQDSSEVTSVTTSEINEQSQGNIQTVVNNTTYDESLTTEQNSDVEKTTETNLDDSQLVVMQAHEADEKSENDEPEQNNYSGVVITQVQTTGGTNRAGEDLIELRNNSSEDVDITGWRVAYAGATAVSMSTVAHLRPTEVTPGWRLVLPTGAYYLLGTQALVDAHATLEVDQLFTTAIATVGGRLMVYDASDELVSAFAWGTATVWPEGNPFSPAANVMERKMHDDVWHQNTRNNLADFAPGTLRTGYLLGQAEEVFDHCLNIAGIQSVVPEGWYRDDISGNCSDTVPPMPPELNRCVGLVISEVGANLSEQFIEVYNAGDEAVDLGGCRLLTNRSTTKYFQFGAEELAAGDHRAVMIPDEADLTLTKTTSGTVYLVSEDGLLEVDSVSYANLRADTSWALFADEWHQTYAPTPGEPNVYEQFLPCDVGYVRNVETGRCNAIVLVSEPAPCAPNQYRNPDTGRCRLIETGSTLAPCREGQYRHPETNRCRNLSTTASTLVPCREGQERNPATNRCRAIASTADQLKPCQDGWERNPDTNRCRKIATLGSVTDFPVEPIVDTGKGFAAWWALGGITLLGAGYGAWEWRRELATGMRRMGGMVRK